MGYTAGRIAWHFYHLLKNVGSFSWVVIVALELVALTRLFQFRLMFRLDSVPEFDRPVKPAIFAFDVLDNNVLGRPATGPSPREILVSLWRRQDALPKSDHSL